MTGVLRPWLLLPLLLALLPQAFAQQLGPKVVAGAAEVAAAVARSPLSPALTAYAADIGKLAVNVESGGNLGLYNGSCCTGVLQVNRGGLAKYCGCTAQEYANMALQQQVDVWAKVTNANAANATVQNLMAMGRFGGRAVDGAMVLSCIQIGPGNCAKTLQAGTCSTSAGSDGNGNNFCDFAARIDGAAGGASAALSEANLPVGAAPPLLPAANYQYPSPDEAFFAGAGVEEGQARELVLSALSVAVFLWAAWVALAQHGSWRRGRIDLMALQANLVGSAVLALLVLGLAMS